MVFQCRIAETGNKSVNYLCQGYQQKSPRVSAILNTTSLYVIPVVNVASMSSAHELDCSGSSFTGTDFDTAFDDKSAVSCCLSLLGLLYYWLYS